MGFYEILGAALPIAAWFRANNPHNRKDRKDYYVLEACRGTGVHLPDRLKAIMASEPVSSDLYDTCKTFLRLYFPRDIDG